MIGVRVIAAVLAGPIQPLALAQTAPAPVAAPPPPPPLPDRGGRHTDVYDVAAGAVTVVKAPFNALTCGMGTGVAAILFLITLGSGYKASARVVEEGCKGPWLITGDDLRPDPPRSEVPLGGNP